MKMRLLILALCGICGTNPSLQGQATTEPAPPTTKPMTSAIGPRFESLSAGIGFCPPADMKEVRGTLGTTEVVRFSNEQNHWIMKVTRLILEQDKPLPLDSWKDKIGIDHPGMLQFTIDQLTADNRAIEMVRQDTVNIGSLSVGMIAARFNFGLETNLTQEAVVRASDQQYFIIAMTSPAPHRGDLDDDPAVKIAVDAFNNSIDTVALLDQSMIKLDQEARLDRTRTLFFSLSADKLRKSLVKQQWLRVLRDGQDVGYTYTVQEIGHDVPRKGKPERQVGPEGVLVGQRTRLTSPRGEQIDSEKWSFCAFDRRYEDWSTVAVSMNGKKMLGQVGELGVTRWREHPVAEPQGIGAKPVTSLAEQYRLEVTQLNSRKASAAPLVRDLPPYYLPQAIELILPQVLPLREAKTYLFASWISDAQQVMFRYLDVGYEQDVTFNGKALRAITIKDRVGLEGPLTVHYIDPSGDYLGSENEQTGITMLASDETTLAKLWKDANLSRPGAVDEAK